MVRLLFSTIFGAAIGGFMGRREDVRWMSNGWNFGVMAMTGTLGGAFFGLAVGNVMNHYGISPSITFRQNKPPHP